MENKNSLISYFNLTTLIYALYMLYIYKALIVFKIVTLRNIF